MLIAQTGSNTLSLITEPQGTTPVSNLWWMLPLALAIFALAWYLRPRKSISRPTAKSSKGADRKSSIRTRDVVPESATQDSLNSDQQSSKTNGSKKKKSSKKKKIASSNKPTQSLPVASSVSEVEKSTVSSVTLALQNVATVTTVAKEGPEPKPVNAIFEPLLDAVKERRKLQYFDDSVDSGDSSTTSKQREPDLVQQLFGGKFERIVPRASIRSHADRWPASSSQQVKNTEIPAPRPQPVEIAKPEAVRGPDAPAPAKGLKSFVSKVKKSDVPSDAVLPPSESD